MTGKELEKSISEQTDFCVCGSESDKASARKNKYSHADNNNDNNNNSMLL